MNNLTFRYANENDTALILHFIKELADYEHMLNEVVATEELLKEWIFEKQKAEVIFALENNKEIGFALFFHNFPHFWDVLVFILRTYTYIRNIVVKVTANPF